MNKLATMIEDLLTIGGNTQRQKNGNVLFKVRNRKNRIQVLAFQEIACGSYKRVMRVWWLAGSSPFNNLVLGDSYAYAKLIELQDYRNRYKKNLGDSTACIPKDVQDDLSDIHRELIEEVSISQTLPEDVAVHMDVVYSYRQKERPKGLVMKYYECGNLREVCTSPLNLFSIYLQRMNYAYDLAKKLMMIHAAGYCHLDFTTAQILVREQQSQKIIVTDFGMAALIGSSIDEFRTSPPYAAPELLGGVREKKVDTAWDAWSLGICILEIMYGLEKNVYRKSYIVEEILEEDINDQKRLKYEAEWCRLQKRIIDSLTLRGEIHDVIRRVISGLLDINPAMRWTVEQAEHALFYFLFQFTLV